MGLCPRLQAPIKIALLSVGANRSSSVNVTLGAADQWTQLWRPTLAEELTQQQASQVATAWNEYGWALRCAADVHSGSGATGEEPPVVFAAPANTLWQWPAERIGLVRSVWLPAADFEETDISSAEALWEAAARHDHDEDREWGATEGRRVEMETLAVSPPIFRVRSFLPGELMDELRRHAAPIMEPSTVGDPSLSRAAGSSNGHRKQDDRRTSTSAWLHGYNDPRLALSAARAVQRATISLLRNRMSRVLRSVEPLLAVAYSQGEFYEPHHDFFAGGGASLVATEPAFKPPHGSNRYATVIVYLNDFDGGDDGGATVFPFANPPENETGTVELLPGTSYAGSLGAPQCSFPALRQQRGLMVHPSKGDAILFYDQLPNGTFDGRTRHGSCPVRRGRKLAINVWVWNRDVIYRR